MNRVLNLAAFNIRVLLGDPTWFILSWALFALQLAIYGSLISRLVGSSLPNYFFFYSIGLMVIVVFESAEDVGRHFVEHAHEGELPYFLSLPVSRSGFLIAQAIYGVVNTLVKVAPPLLAVLFIWGNLTVSGALFALAALFLLGLGITGTMKDRDTIVPVIPHPRSNSDARAKQAPETVRLPQKNRNDIR